MPATRGYTYIILVNWNGWHDTIECLESLFRMDAERVRVIVSDNGSDDGSCEAIRAWAQGDFDIIPATTLRLRYLSHPPVRKPIPIESVSGSGAAFHLDRITKVPLILLENKSNLGFAGGNNAAIRLALSDEETDYVWLLNNDTVVDREALRRLRVYMESHTNCGICGATLMHYYKPDVVQAQGGSRYNPWIAVGYKIGEGMSRQELIEPALALSQLSYVEGASMFVRRNLVERIGLMSEEFFLYFEELDWSERVHGHFTLGYAADSFVYHKEGRSIGTSADPTCRSLSSDYFLLRNRIRISRKYYSWALLTVYAGLCVSLAKRLARRQWAHARMVCRVLAGR